MFVTSRKAGIAVTHGPIFAILTWKRESEVRSCVKEIISIERCRLQTFVEISSSCF